ncbi:MAG: nitroreductase family protein [Acidobacteria bacterium]|nr:nitroreductase family protein [Acidobacteriota bacterium]
MAQDLDSLKHGPKETGVEELILKRWSPRSYADKPVSSEDLTKVFTAAAWAASSYNEQPWRFIVGKKGDETYAKILDALIEFNQTWAKTAPVLILSVAKKTFTQNGQPNAYGLHDTGAASANLSLQATALGMHTHGMGGVDKDKARANFAIPDEYEVGAAWALGYLGEPTALPEPYAGMEVAPRTRKPLQEIVFSAWEKPATL